MNTDSSTRYHTGPLLRRAQQLHLALWNREVSLDVSSVQFAALSVLERRPGVGQVDLGAELDLDRSTIADLVRRLEAGGLITRTASTADRRRFELHLTEAGRAQLERGRPIALAIEDELFGELSPEELSALRRYLMTMLRLPA